MQTGIKAVDQLILKHGIMADLGSDTFQRRSRLTGGDERANALPFCMYQKWHMPLCLINSRCITFICRVVKGSWRAFCLMKKGS